MDDMVASVNRGLNFPKPMFAHSFAARSLPNPLKRAYIDIMKLPFKLRVNRTIR